ncbi:hypothetical protein F0259_09885 [Vibrio cyclitrophicus]|nr:hypothetical protein ACS79_14105 [Vibrio lentus]NOH44122.1 hypothetical protein [Vibrio cyclitrophicus]OEE27727.1 hypothetical protein OAW_18910 [Vibrio cyclitrophicus ZF170]OEF34393.1 hypothetical protein OA7_08485 [Vibrio cyclitrophicus 1F53]OEF67063.1 hypothetical protein OAA_06480 [Vibrio cyclitrophicus 1F175]
MILRSPLKQHSFPILFDCVKATLRKLLEDVSMTCLKYREKVLLIFVSKCLKNFFGFHGMDIKDRPYVENIYYRNIASHLLRHKRDWLSSTPTLNTKEKVSINTFQLHCVNLKSLPFTIINKGKEKKIYSF